jgi:hypothetical protein
VSAGTPAPQLLAALRAFLREDLQPQLSGVSAYGNRIACNLLGTLARELQHAPELNDLDRRYASVRGFAAEDLPRQLALALRDAGDCGDEALRTYLRRRVLCQLAIDNPRYAGYLQARQRWLDVDAGTDDGGDKT